MSQCRSRGSLCLGDDPDFAVAIECGGQINTCKCNHAWII